MQISTKICLTEINIAYWDTLYTVMLYIRVSTFSFCLRPTNSLSESLPFETGRYSRFILLQLTFSLPLSFFLSSLSLFLSISVLPELCRREIYFRPSHETTIANFVRLYYA